MPNSVPFLSLARQYEGIRSEIDQAIAEVVSSGQFVGGPVVKRFEEGFRHYAQADHCVAVGNGTDAIELVLEGLGLPPGSEVIVPANSFIATSEAVTRGGYRVVFADVLPQFHTLDPEDVARRITSSTSAIVGVHLYGQPFHVDEILDLAKPRGLALIEDTAQAHGAKIGGRVVGTLASAGTFSFYPGKNLGAFGDAGAVTTNDSNLADRVRMTANHGRISKYNHEFEGRNSRMDTLQAAVLTVKLNHIQAWTERRRAIAAMYRSGLTGVGDLRLPDQRPGAYHVFHLFVVRTDSRDGLRAFLDGKGVSTGVHYPTALPDLPAYASHPQRGEPLLARSMSGELLSLPIGDMITDDEVAQVIDGVREFYGANA